jgi:hypothetical protein
VPDNPTASPEPQPPIGSVETIRRLTDAYYAYGAGFGIGDTIFGGNTRPNPVRTPPTPPSRPAIVICANVDCGRQAYASAYGESPCIVCAKCKQCNRCGCGCKPCKQCDPSRIKRFGLEHFCKTCGGGCRTLCKCRKRRGYMPLNLKNETFHYNDLRRPMGMELELAEWGSLPRTIKYLTYSIVRDGSVEPSGKEMVVAPLVGDRFLRAVLELGKQFVQHDVSVNSTCGFHVHCNAMDMDWWSIRRLVWMYAKFEAEIYDEVVWAERSAPSNTFCVRNAKMWEGLAQRLKRTNDPAVFKAELIETLTNSPVLNPASKGKAWVEMKSKKYGGEHRYLGLNLHSYFYRGTVEWRMFDGTIDVEDMMYWPLLVGWIVEKANTLNDRQVQKLTTLRSFVKDHVKVGGMEGWLEKRKQMRADDPTPPLVAPSATLTYVDLGSQPSRGGRAI